MAYSELIKDFGRIRDYMRQFFVYGFKSRTEYKTKSARSYDNERRRIESWLHDYMCFRQGQNGKNLFLSVDSRDIKANPLYKAFKTKSFTAGEVTFHFYLLDMLADGRSLSISEIMDIAVESYLSSFENAEALDESTVRKKLKEYVENGLLVKGKRGRETVYSLSKNETELENWKEALSFFSEQAPLGVIGSFLLDKFKEVSEIFNFKHHYILHAIDSEVLCELLLAMSEKCCVDITVNSLKAGAERKNRVYPYKIYSSVQAGRQYLYCFHYKAKKPIFYRLDRINSVKIGPHEKNYEHFEKKCQMYSEKVWGVSTTMEPLTDHLELTIFVGRGEGYIIRRLLREKRNGSVEQIGKNLWLYKTDVYDAYELMPWIRTFIGRIVKLSSTNKRVEAAFNEDFEAMKKLYNGEKDAV